MFIGLALLRCLGLVYPKTLEWSMYDIAVRHLVPELVADERVVIVEISNQSLADMNQTWPFPRSAMARFVRQLSRAEPAVVALDMVFQTPSRQLPAQLLDELRQALSQEGLTEDAGAFRILDAHMARLDDDTQLARAIADSGRVVLGNIVLTAAERLRTSWHPNPHLESNIPLLEASAIGLGILNADRDWDGVVRRYTYVARVGEERRPSLALAALQNAFPERAREFAERARSRDDGIPLLRFPRSGIRRVQFSDIMWNEDDAALRSLLQGRVVFVGVTAAGLHDQHATPIQNVLPGVELHAFAAMNLLGDTHYQSHGLAAWCGLALTALAVIFLLVATEKLSLPWLLASVPLLGAAYLAIMYAFLVTTGWLLAFAPVAGAALAIAGAEGLFRVRVLRRQRRAVEEQERMNTAKSEFMATMSHELRTPLTSIRGSLGLIAGGAMGEIQPSIAELIGIAHSNTERLIRLVNNFLDFQKMSDGKMEFRFEELDLASLLEDTVKANRGYAEQFGVDIELTCAEGQKVSADSDLLTQAVTNLLSNAIKFSPKGETVQVTSSVREDTIRIAVIDRGPGIPEEFRPRIFRRFAQAADANSAPTKGSGLGLSIVKLIVEEHGGAVSFDSETGEGTSFYIDLPPLLEEAPAPPSEENETATDSA